MNLVILKMVHCQRVVLNIGTKLSCVQFLTHVYFVEALLPPLNISYNLNHKAPGFILVCLHIE